MGISYSTSLIYGYFGSGTKLVRINGNLQYTGDLSDISDIRLKEGLSVITGAIEKEFPELVSENDEGYKMVDYIKMTPVLLQAIKEQQDEINELKAMVEKLMELKSHD